MNRLQNFNLALDMDDFWVFGYDSLMWPLGFAFEERQQARLQRLSAFALYQFKRDRGTEEKPGLCSLWSVAAFCFGITSSAWSPKDHDLVMAYLRERGIANW